MTSKPTEFHPGDLVMHRDLGISIVGQNAATVPLPGDKWYITQTIINKKREVPGVPESLLRPLTFGEFLFYTDPATGGLKIGKNKAWPLLFANALALFGIIATTYYLATGDDLTVALALIPCIGVPVFTILGTLANWKNRQM